MKVCTFLFTALFAFALSGAQINWTTNYEAALDTAKEQNKPILLFFTGSDWCSWCKKLDKEVFDQPTFADLAKDHFIFVKLDQPRQKTIDPQTLAQNRELQRKYNVSGFPQVILIDKNERKIGTTGYRAGGPKSYYDHLLNISR